MSIEKELERFLTGLDRRNPHQPEFQQAVEDVARSVFPAYLEREDWREARILERLTEPDRVVSFRVTWQTDRGEVRADRAWRVQFNHALGPYKGGLRFHRSVNESVLKFLGFEQVLKNSLTGLPMGGAKGGANFDPRGRSDGEVMRFCQSLMIELHRHIGEDVDVPAGDIGVGTREISYLFGQYTRLENRWAGVLTGKDSDFGGSAIRSEATGYGCVYFCERMLEHHDEGIEGRRVAVSGSGNVALHAAEKAAERGARVLSLSDSDGLLHAADGLDREQIAAVAEHKRDPDARLAGLGDRWKGVRYEKGAKPWSIGCDVAMPCATQNELDADDARALVEGGVRVVCEGANMPTTAEATRVLREEGVLHAPGKAANAGGVAVSGLELSQNAMRMPWSRDAVDDELQGIMADIHARCAEEGERDGRVDYVDGANLAGFRKVADAMLAHGLV
jgi:glutamate dehydrogenase (NADP+)